jgi:hypothetical protein
LCAAFSQSRENQFAMPLLNSSVLFRRPNEDAARGLITLQPESVAANIAKLPELLQISGEGQ